MPRRLQTKSPLGPRKQTAFRLDPQQLSDFESARYNLGLSKRQVIEQGLPLVTSLPEGSPYGTQRKIVNLMLPPELLDEMRTVAKKYGGGLAETVHACSLAVVKK